MFSMIFAAIRSRLASYAAAVIAAAAILLGAYHKGRKDAAAKQDRLRLDAIRKAREIENEVDGLHGGAVGARLARWMRDK